MKRYDTKKLTEKERLESLMERNNPQGVGDMAGWNSVYKEAKNSRGQGSNSNLNALRKPTTKQYELLVAYLVK